MAAPQHRFDNLFSIGEDTGVRKQINEDRSELQRQHKANVTASYERVIPMTCNRAGQTRSATKLPPSSSSRPHSHPRCPPLKLNEAASVTRKLNECRRSLVP
jgi:hypothetical protein